MDIVIPPRDHGSSTFHYKWDENGEVTQITRVKEDSTHPPVVQERQRRGRQTMHWPFQSIATDITRLSTPTTASPFARRATWQPKKPGDTDSIAQDIIPDYVINYIRGETPEMVARRTRNDGKLGERAVDIAHQHRIHQSRAANFEGFFDADSDRPRSSTGSQGGEERRILSGGRDGDNKGWRQLLVGWRAGVALNLLLAFVIALTGFVCFILVLAKTQLARQSVLFSGSCGVATGLDWGLHAVANVFGVVLIAGANYVFQVLSSPTRKEVAAAHQKKTWLDIGVPSVRNLAHIEKIRTLLAIVILVSAVVVQVLYNAVIFISTNITDAGQALQTCDVGVNGTLLGVAALLNLVIVIAIATVLARASFAPLATLGDAITSFLRDPDPSTRGACLLSKTDVRLGRWGGVGLNEAKYWVPRKHYWFSSPSLPHWLFTILVWCACAGLAAAALVVSLMAEHQLSPFGADSSSSSGSSSSITQLQLQLQLPSSVSLPAAALIASLPHILLAALYFATNSLLTTYWLSHESSLFASRPPAALRVSARPVGAQTTSLYLTLPRPASWCLLAWFMGMGFVASQSLGVVATTTATTSPVALGISGIGLLTLLSMLVLLACVVIGLGVFRSAPPAGMVNGEAVGNPMALRGGSCSVVLGSRCHLVDKYRGVRAEKEKEPWRYPLVWGVVHEGADEVGMTTRRTMGMVGHCSFTAGTAVQVDVGRCYA
ncbi:hypothetical protein B0T17DRAFT_496885 [Bombardia bombarda]|uniref:DUF6536 domain-containing protein n=1 Tax=Bombardia bombarda TaxID=252184 RepID=A0AA39WIL2_9PEZI|nr:hypothetical protein B0T17DRAFT_496885 [Bombardia bombarda]